MQTFEKVNGIPTFKSLSNINGTLSPFDCHCYLKSNLNIIDIDCRHRVMSVTDFYADKHICLSKIYLSIYIIHIL